MPLQLKRARPYFYSDADVMRIMGAAKQMVPPDGLRGRTYSCVVGLLAVTGLRISEVVHLERQDVDFDESMLIVRKSKFGKTRLVPLHSIDARYVPSSGRIGLRRSELKKPFSCLGIVAADDTEGAPSAATRNRSEIQPDRSFKVPSLIAFFLNESERVSSIDIQYRGTKRRHRRRAIADIRVVQDVCGVHPDLNVL